MFSVVMVIDNRVLSVDSFNQRKNAENHFISLLTSEDAPILNIEDYAKAHLDAREFARGGEFVDYNVHVIIRENEVSD